MLKRLPLLILVSLPTLVAQRSVQLTPGQVVTDMLPSRAPYNAIGDFRIEFRVESWARAADYSSLVNLNRFDVRWTSAGALFFSSSDDPVPGAGSIQSVNVSGAQQFVVRFQRDRTNRRLTAEWWDLATGAHTVTIPDVSFKSDLALINSAGGPVTLGGAYTTCKLAYLKWFTGTVPVGTLPSAGPGDLLDLEFENNLKDSRHKLNLSGGKVTFTDTQHLPPLIIGKTPYTVRAGTPATLDGTGSFSAENKPITYLWTQISGPAKTRIANPAAASTTVEGLTEFGSYVFRLAASDGANSSHKDYKIGAVITDDHDIVQVADPAIKFVLGPLTRWGTSPWPWFDMTERAVADVLDPAATFDSGRPLLPGTLHAEHVQSVDAWRLVCDDAARKPCDFALNFHTYRTGGLLKSIAVANNVATASIGLPHGLKVEDIVAVGCANGHACPANLAKDYPGYTITAVPSPTTVQFNTHRVEGGKSYDVADGVYTNDTNVGMYASVRKNLIAVWYDAPGEAPGTGRAIFDIAEVVDNSHMWLYNYVVLDPITDGGHQYSAVDPVEVSNWTNGNNNWNYYDGGVLAAYRLYYRTGIDDHLAAARRMADLWWTYGLDHGNQIPYPRIAAIHGMVMRALDGRPEMWRGIKTYMNYHKNDIPFPAHTSFDPRESGYYLKYKALTAELAANSDGTPDRATRAAYCSYVKNEVNNLWVVNQLENGSFPYDPFAENPTYPYAGPGMSPFQLGLGAQGLWYAYLALQEPGGCNDQAAAQTTLGVLGKALKFAYTQGIGKGRGAFYAVNFYAVPWYADGRSTDTGPGTVTVGKGTRVVKGTNTKFRSYFLCDGKDYIGLYSNRKVYKVVSCDSDTQLTLDTAVADGIIQESGYQLARAAQSGCGPSVAAYCQPNTGDRALIADMIMPFGAYYWVTGDAQYKAWGDDLFSAGFGGAGSVGGYCQPYVTAMGPGGDGGFVYNFADACNYGAANAMGKGRGMTAGAGAAQNYLAYRVAAADPACKDLAMSPASGAVPADGGTGSITVTVTDQSCRWTATPAAGWLTISGGASGIGNGSIGWSAAANPGGGRSATITAGSATFTAAQAGSSSRTAQ